MNKAISLVCVLTLVLLIAGCQSADVNEDSSAGQMSIETDDGSVEIETNMQDADSDEWCPEGGEWTMTTNNVGGTNAQWRIDKLMTSGEYEGLCHVIYTAQTPEGEMRMDYYFDESGENGYVEMDMNGQTVKQEWHQ